MINIDDIKFKEGKRHQAGMTVPENFFSNFQSNLEKEIDRVEAEKKENAAPIQPTISISSPGIQPARRAIITRWVSIAACAAVLVGVAVFAYNFDQATTTDSVNELTASSEIDADYSDEADQMIISSFDDFYLYDLYCDTNY